MSVPRINTSDQVRVVRERLSTETEGMSLEALILHLRKVLSILEQVREGGTHVEIMPRPVAIIYADRLGDGTVCYVAEDPSLPGCVSYAHTPEEAAKDLEDARKAYLSVIGSRSSTS